MRMVVLVCANPPLASVSGDGRTRFSVVSRRCGTHARHDDDSLARTQQQINGIFQWVVDGKDYIIDLKALTAGAGKAAKPDVTLTISEKDFLDLMSGKGSFVVCDCFVLYICGTDVLP